MNYIFRTVPALALIFSATPATFGSITMSIDKLDPSDGLPLPPANIVVADVFVDVSDDQAWAGGGIFGSTTAFGGAGARLVRLTHNETPVFTAPGAENRFVTFVNRPRDRDSDERFGPDGAVGVDGHPSGPATPVLDESTISLVWYRLPPVPPPPSEIGRDGYVVRIAVDLTNVVDPAFRTDSENIIVATSPPPGALILFQSIASPEGGTFVNTYGFDSDQTDWGIYGVPEPATGFILLLGCCCLRPRR